MNFVVDLLDNDAPDEKSALLTLQGNVSYGELRLRVRRLAGYLQHCGLQPGERVLLIAESSAFWVCAYLGIALAGGVCVPLPVLSDKRSLEECILRTDPRCTVIQSHLLRRLAGSLVMSGPVIVDQLPPQKTSGLRLHTMADIEDESFNRTNLPLVADNDLAAIMFTSGSTARPRGVMISHGNIRSNTRDIITALDLVASDRIMSVLPFFYCFGTSLLHTHLKVGGSIVIDNRFLFPDKVLRRMIDTACTGLAGVPSTFQILLRQSSLKRMHFPALRKVQQAGGRLPGTFIRELEAALPDAALFIMYGQTEATARLSCIHPSERLRHPDSIGRGLSHVRLEVLNAAGMPVSPGEVGEIVASGPNIASGYWDEPEASGETFRDGRLHTGDLATIDEEGFISIVDRAGDFLKCGGNRVSCREIEESIHNFEGIVAAAVVGIPDDLLGEAVCLFAVHPKGEAAKADLLRFCAKNLARHVVPHKIVFLQNLPQNSSGKYDKPTLKREWSRLWEAGGS